MNRHRRTTLFAILLAAAALASGCGGGGGSGSAGGAQPVGQWAESFCSAASTWTTAVQAAVKPLRSGDVSTTTLKSATTDLKDATNTFVDDVKALGRPDTQSGAEVKATLDGLADQLASGVDTIKKTADGVSSAAEATTAIGTIGDTVTTMGNQAQTALSDVQKSDTKGELEKALKDAPACKKLTGAA